MAPTDCTPWRISPAHLFVGLSFVSRRLLGCCEFLALSTSRISSILKTVLHEFHRLFVESPRNENRQVLAELQGTRVRVQQPINLLIDKINDCAPDEGFRNSFLVTKSVPLLDVLLFCSIDIAEILHNISMLLNKPTLVGRRAPYL